jgi:hypothetical protein
MALSSNCGSTVTPEKSLSPPDARADSRTSTSANPPLASVYLATSVGTEPGASTSTCNIQGSVAPLFHIGSMGVPIANGQPYSLPSGTGEAAVTLDCVVHPDGNGFDVNVQVSQGETDAFSFTTTTPLTDSPNAQSGVSVSLGLNPNTYSDSTDCTFTLSLQGNPSITAGRIWGTVVCPTSTYAEVNATCYASATFIIQNCSE